MGLLSIAGKLLYYLSRSDQLIPLLCNITSKAYNTTLLLPSLYSFASRSSMILPKSTFFFYPYYCL